MTKQAKRTAITGAMVGIIVCDYCWSNINPPKPVMQTPDSASQNAHEYILNAAQLLDSGGASRVPGGDCKLPRVSYLVPSTEIPKLLRGHNKT